MVDGSKKKNKGLNKRKQSARLGSPTPPDESKVKSPQTATAFWLDSGRAELSTGMSVRVDPAVDVAAFPAVHSALRKYAKNFAERLMSAHLVAGIEPVVKQLDEILSLSHVSEHAGTQQSPDELVVAACAKWAMSRRKAIARLYKGPKNRALRHAFGINQPMKITSVEEVRDGVLALLAGRAANPHTPAGRLIHAGDIKKAKEYVARLNEIRTSSGARRQSNAEQTRTRDVMHAALELFYDRFGAAADLVFEDDDATRVAMLSMIPRRKADRRAAEKPPVTGTVAKTA